jgi:hypothetical protein
MLTHHHAWQAVMSAAGCKYRQSVAPGMASWRALRQQTDAQECHLLPLRLIRKASSAISSSTPATQPITIPAMAPPLKPPPLSVSPYRSLSAALLMCQGRWQTGAK